MVFRAISFWSAPRPQEVEEFETYYREVHAPYAARVPGMLKLGLTLAGSGLEDSPADFYRVAEVWFEDKDAFLAATETTEWAEMRRDGEYVKERFGVTLTSGLGDIVEAPLDPGGPRPDAGSTCVTRKS